MNADTPKQKAMVRAKPASVVFSTHRPARSRRSAFVLFGQCLAIVGLFLGSYFFFSHWVVQSVRVAGSSMLPNLRDADVYLVNRVSCLLRTPRHGEIVVLKDPTDQQFAVKRIIGVEGDLVELRGGSVYVNGKRLFEPYLTRGTQTFPFDSLTQVVRCGPGQCFVLGDNRSHSSDSRCYGAIPGRAILGFVVR
jgi:signal peptidase I